MCSNAGVHALPLQADEVVMVGGIAVTSLARTVLDLACQLPMDRAVAIGDAALRCGVRDTDLPRLLERAGRRHGIGARPAERLTSSTRRPNRWGNPVAGWCSTGTAFPFLSCSIRSLILTAG